MEKKRMNIRAITSLTVSLSFGFMALSGVILFISPKGRVANWTGWNMLGLDKESWGSVHTTIGLLFVVAGVLHLIYNWKVFLNYLKKPFAVAKSKSFKEVVIASTIVLAVIFGTAMELQPFNVVSAVGSDIKNYWEVQSVAGPYAHAEEDTLAEFARKLNRPEEDLLERLEMKGFKAESLDVTLGGLATQYSVNPSDIFAALSSGGAANPTGARNGAGGGMGSGFGRKTLEQVCQEYNLELDEVIAKLEEDGVTASGSENIRSLAEKSGMVPRDFVQLLGVNDIH